MPLAAHLQKPLFQKSLFNTRREALLTLASSASLLLPTLALSQDKFPSRPITLIAPWPPGGSSDGVMRAFGEALGRALGGATVIVQNKPGAGGILGAEAMVSAKPDGYTLTQLPLGVYRLPHMQKTGYDPIKDLTHIACLTGYTFLIAASLNAPFKTLKEMVEWAKANPKKLNYGHTGTGTTPHLAFAEFANKAGIEVQDIPYKGTADLLPALLGGHIPVMSGTTETVPLAKEGKLRLLATLGRARNKAFPDVPTAKEHGWDTVSESPFGIGGPKGMSPALVKQLNEALKKTLDDPKVLEALDRYYQPIIYMDSEAYSRYAVATYAQERATVEKLGLMRKE
jgi:tripartite-type tricarboxylate transporter receptor subunit TctC